MALTFNRPLEARNLTILVSKMPPIAISLNPPIAITFKVPNVAADPPKKSFEIPRNVTKLGRNRSADTGKLTTDGTREGP